MKWTTYNNTRPLMPSLVYHSSTADYKARIEVYAGRGKRMVCEWSVEWTAGLRTDYDVCYGLPEAKRQVDRAIAARWFVMDARRERDESNPCTCGMGAGTEPPEHAKDCAFYCVF